MDIDRTAWELRGLRRLEQWTGFLFGLLAGLTLLVAGWGIDALSMLRAGGILAWAKFLVAAACLVIPLGGIGWLSIRLKHAAFAAVLWLFAGVAFGWLAVQLSFRYFPWALARWAPETAGHVAYRFGIGATSSLVVACVLSGAVFFFAGLVMHNLIEGSSRAAYPAGRYLSILGWIGMFALAGTLADALVNVPLRAPVMTLDRLISMRLADPGFMDTEQASILHASVFNPVDDLLPRPHRMVAVSIDKDLSMVRVLIDFQGEWVRCTTIEGQPSFCEPVN